MLRHFAGLPCGRPSLRAWAIPFRSLPISLATRSGSININASTLITPATDLLENPVNVASATTNRARLAMLRRSASKVAASTAAFEKSIPTSDAPVRSATQSPGPPAPQAKSTSVSFSSTSTSTAKRSVDAASPKGSIPGIKSARELAGQCAYEGATITGSVTSTQIGSTR